MTIQRPQPTLSKRLFGWFRKEHEQPTPQDIQVRVMSAAFNEKYADKDLTDYGYNGNRVDARDSL